MPCEICIGPRGSGHSETCFCKYCDCDDLAPLDARLPGQIGVTSRGTPVFGVRGQAVPEDGQGPTTETAKALRLLRAMTEAQRGIVFAWFCRGCCRFIGPGESCTCERDD